MADKSVNAGGDVVRYIEGASEPLSAENYNDADGLVFAELSYVRFEDCKTVSKDMSLAEFADKLLESGVEKNKDKIALLQAIKESPRYANCKVTNFASADRIEDIEEILDYENCKVTDFASEDHKVTNLVNQYNDAQWAAVTVQISDGDSDTSIVAMRGTDRTTNGWVEDFELFYDQDGTGAQQLSAKYLKTVEGDSIFLAGHSKGGNDVIYAYLASESSIRDRVVKINNYDGPGVNPEIRNDSEFLQAYKELDDKLYNIYPYNSIIGLLLIDNPGQSTYVNCDTEGHNEIPVIGTHDGHSFMMNPDGSFEEREQAEYSKYINKLLDEVMYKLSKEERREVITLLVTLGVPALIAGEGYEEVQSNEFLEKLYEKIPLVYHIARAITVWNCSSSEQKAAFIKTLVVIWLTVKEDPKPFFEMLEQIIEYGFNALVSYVKKKANDLVDGVKSIGKQVKEGLKEAYYSVMSFLEENLGWKNVISAAASNGFYRSTYFSANISSMKAAAASMHEIENKLQQYGSQIQGVLSNTGSIRNRLKITAAVVKIADVKRDCNCYSTALEDIAGIYESAENRLLMN